MAESIHLRELVRFDPPDQAYSTECLQHQYRGKVGLVKELWNDGYAFVLFGKQVVFCNSTYLTEVKHTPVNSWAGLI